MAVYTFPHGPSEWGQVSGLFLSLLCTQWLVQEKLWKNLFASNLMFMVFPLARSRTGPQSFLCVLVLAGIELMFFRGALTGLSRICAENTIGSARIFLLLLSSTYTKEPRPFLFLIPPCQETGVVQGDLEGTAGCNDLRDIPYHMTLCSAM